MTMEIKEKLTIERMVTVGYKCDNCGNIHNGNDMPETWHSFSTGHNAWGNDSIDSVDDYIVCSVNCYLKVIEESIKELDGCFGAYIDEFTLDFAKELLKRCDVNNITD